MGCRKANNNENLGRPNPSRSHGVLNCFILWLIVCKTNMIQKNIERVTFTGSFQLWKRVTWMELRHATWIVDRTPVTRDRQSQCCTPWSRLLISVPQTAEPCNRSQWSITKNVKVVSNKNQDVKQIVFVSSLIWKPLGCHAHRSRWACVCDACFSIHERTPVFFCPFVVNLNLLVTSMAWTIRFWCGHTVLSERKEKRYCKQQIRSSRTGFWCCKPSQFGHNRQGTRTTSRKYCFLRFLVCTAPFRAKYSHAVGETITRWCLGINYVPWQTPMCTSISENNIIHLLLQDFDTSWAPVTNLCKASQQAGCVNLSQAAGIVHCGTGTARNSRFCPDFRKCERSATSNACRGLCTESHVLYYDNYILLCGAELRHIW